jgi:hypothetical protein
MKYRCLILTLAVAILAVGLVACEPKGPMAEVDNVNFDFGTIDQQSAAEHVFLIKNTGDKELEIKRTRSTCGCTVAKPSKKNLKPGESAEIKVTFNAGSRFGAQDKKVTVETNDPKNAQITLNITGNVTQLLTFEPRQLRFNDLEKGKSDTQSIVLTNESTGPLTLKEAKIEAADIITVEPEGKSWPVTLQQKEQLTLKVTAKLPEDKPMYHGRVELIQEGKEDRPLSFYVAIREKGYLKAQAQKAGGKDTVISKVAEGMKKAQKVQKKKNKDE